MVDFRRQTEKMKAKEPPPLLRQTLPHFLLFIFLAFFFFRLKRLEVLFSLSVRSFTGSSFARSPINTSAIRKKEVAFPGGKNQFPLFPRQPNLLYMNLVRFVDLTISKGLICEVILSSAFLSNSLESLYQKNLKKSAVQMDSAL
ncbi:hypothetical protein EBO34_13240 [Alteribacter keqinensis]|uniref:Uncharacterized protein n=1 Tax=Alteribacter keqinensis TaxID=2483800 RepID=A0A3M7TRM1_9BACI|nr:hypothetical protein EBO34_13240 [Alteribacter keqinensis]